MTEIEEKAIQELRSAFEEFNKGHIRKSKEHNEKAGILLDEIRKEIMERRAKENE